jgi:hypothetical protein
MGEKLTLPVPRSKLTLNYFQIQSEFQLKDICKKDTSCSAVKIISFEDALMVYFHDIVQLFFIQGLTDCILLPLTFVL